MWSSGLGEIHSWKPAYFSLQLSHERDLVITYLANIYSKILIGVTLSSTFSRKRIFYVVVQNVNCIYPGL